VFEVQTRPPSICYHTQSYPARPISLVRRNADSWSPIVTYSPTRGTYCARDISSDLAESLIQQPTLYRVQWAPQEGDAIVRTALTGP
jgi:hypothetical protein